MTRRTKKLPKEGETGGEEKNPYKYPKRSGRIDRLWGSDTDRLSYRKEKTNVLGKRRMSGEDTDDAHRKTVITSQSKSMKKSMISRKGGVRGANGSGQVGKTLENRKT